MDAIALPRRHASFFEFVVSWVPRARARLLEVGCGEGHLARALDRAGYEVVAIDPEAPEGAIFRRTRLEEFDDDGTFDAVVASVSLHHVDDLAAGVTKLDGLLAPGGLVLAAEFARERLAGATAHWYHAQRRARDPELTADPETWLREWSHDHAHIHSAASVHAAMNHRFDERHFEWTPYLYGYALDDELEPVERALIATGSIEPTGFRYVGERRR